MRRMAERACPNAANHEPGPDGYGEWHQWAEEKVKTHVNEACPQCGLFMIWKPKPERCPTCGAEKDVPATLRPVSCCPNDFHQSEST